MVKGERAVAMKIDSILFYIQIVIREFQEVIFIFAPHNCNKAAHEVATFACRKKFAPNLHLSFDLLRKMGIWDFISGTTDSLKRNALNQTAEKNWCSTPDSLKNVCSTAYDYGSATFIHIDSTVRGNLDHYRQDEEARSKILQLGKIIVTHAAIVGLKTIPGYNIVNNSIKDMKDSDKQEVDVEALQADVRRLDKELSKYRNSMSKSR
ncbi:hypothetical protein PRUPE_4G189500 [Prunus persica]|uniref:Uncharacterized protein n=1 Tax=Prunus persica TaxID=3760 RepID=A0A251PMU6_PRUPE|nr:hypothetical protein PRUPE_4G189500 [Prunus persica]